MKHLVAYASTEGHTRKIARRVLDIIADQGHVAEMLPLADAHDVDIAAYDGIILAASIHINHYQRALSDFASANATALNGKPTLFLSVSLASAGHDAEDWSGLEKIEADLERATNWTPGRVEQVAGAYKPASYDIFRGFIMRRIIMAKQPDHDPDADHDYTDWPALERTVRTWLDSIPRSAQPG